MIQFYGHLRTYSKNGRKRLTEKIFEYIIGLNATSSWVEMIKRIVEAVGTTVGIIHNREDVRSQISNLEKLECKLFNNAPKMALSEEQRKIRSKIIKKVWKEKKK